MAKNLTRLSRFLSFMLRHKPDVFGLVPDSEGFVDVDDVWQQVCQRFGDRYARADFQMLLEETRAGKQRFEVINGRIRAMYGHSSVSVDYPPVVPPEILYHGTTAEAAKAIRQEGLKSQGRQYVHLSTETNRATDVAAWHGQPVILRIRALAAHKAGHVFHHPETKHYLVKAVPPKFILFDEDE